MPPLRVSLLSACVVLLQAIPGQLQVIRDAWYDRQWMHPSNTPHERFLVAAGLNNFAAQMVMMRYGMTPREFLALDIEHAANTMPDIPRAQMVSAVHNGTGPCTTCCACHHSQSVAMNWFLFSGARSDPCAYANSCAKASSASGAD